MSKKHPSDGDLIKLTDSPMFRKNMDRTECTPTGCATGVLIDLSDAIQVPYPKELLMVGEFDDTYGLFTCRPAGASSKSKVVENQSDEPKESTEIDGPPEKKKICTERSKDVFSPVPNNTQPKISTPSTPVQAKMATPVTPCLSESDSIVDFNNLSTFSLSSDPDGFLEENEAFVSPLKKVGNTSKHNSGPVECSGISSEKSAANLGRLQRRNSIVEKMQRLNEIINSPARTPPMSRLNHLFTPSRRPYQQPIQAIPSFSAFSKYSTKSDDVPRSRLSYADNIPSIESNATATETCAPSLQDQLDESLTLVVVKPSMHIQSVTSTSPTYSECGRSDASSVVDGNSSAIKRLSFNSTASSCPSPPLVKSSVFNSTRVKQAPKCFFSSQVTRPQKGMKPLQPLKAFAPISAAAPIITTTGTKMTCASAPVTRKFMPPEVVNTSPGPSKVQTTPRRNSMSYHRTPSKSAGRQSFANVRSSGYGPQPSPSANNNRVIPLSPASVGQVMTTPKAEGRSQTGCRVAKSATKDKPFKAINKLGDTGSIQEVTSGLKRMNCVSIGGSKENLKPRGEPKVLANRPGYVRK